MVESKRLKTYAEEGFPWYGQQTTCTLVWYASKPVYFFFKERDRCQAGNSAQNGRLIKMSHVLQNTRQLSSSSQQRGK